MSKKELLNESQEKKESDSNVETSFLSSRKELCFAYDIKMGNPNGDPDENRPRVLPDGTYYVTDVRLKDISGIFLNLKKKIFL
jgi:CRISPR/Cas system type I-B associated protein Csh2 (Cas7 group RAMP superfamily)